LDFKEKGRRWLEERGQRKVFSRETVIKKEELENNNHTKQCKPREKKNKKKHRIMAPI
jgi:hypothetical protein